MRNAKSPLTSLVSDEDPGRWRGPVKMVPESSNSSCVLWELELHLGCGQIAGGPGGGLLSLFPAEILLCKCVVSH